MMRSLFSGVAGLKTHQTRMDVIGNNIANVNTTAYKSQNMVFSDLLYQTTQSASGANDSTGRGGINPRQIGLGSKTGAISTAITGQGSAQSTNNPWDIMIEGESFFVVNDGSQNFFTRDGSFTVDGAGNLVMANTGYMVMGWQVDPETGDIRKDVVSALQVMNKDNLTSNPEATTKAYLAGILDDSDTTIHSSGGAVRTFEIFDSKGYRYMVKMSFHSTSDEDEFRVQLDDIMDSTGVSLVKKYGLSNIEQIATFGATGDASIPVKQKFEMASGVKYDSVNNKFSVVKSLADILDGYKSNSVLMAIGDDNVEIKAPTSAGDIAQGGDVTVGGTLSLTKAQLENSPYNLIYDDKTGKYYEKGANGLAGQEVADFDAYFQDKLGAGVTVTAKQDPQNQEVITVEVEATFKTTEEVHYDGQSFGQTLDPANQDTENQKKILEQVYGLVDGKGKTYAIDFIGPDGSAQVNVSETSKGNKIVFDHDTGQFSYIGTQGSSSAALQFNTSASTLSGDVIDLTQFSTVDIDFSSINNFGNGGKSTLEFTSGSKDSSAIGKGRKPGELIGIEVGQDGKITASYDNGLTKLLGQIAVAEFANASGLAKAGNNLYSATQNSGEFDGVGKDITESGGSMTSGVLEMSNVDLSSEFTTMITTQRGFQANSRIITTSDTLLEELVNLKR